MYIEKVEGETAKVEVEGFAVVKAISDPSKAVDADKFGEIEAIEVTLKIQDIATGEASKVALPFAYDSKDKVWEVLKNGKMEAADLTGTTLNAVPVATTTVYGYNMTDDGIDLYDLNKIDSATVKSFKGKFEFDGTRTINTYRMNDKTATYVYDTVAKEAAEYTGFAALKNLQVDVEYGVMVLAEDNKTVTELYMMADAGFKAEDKATYAYVMSAWQSGTEEVVADVVIDGELESYVVAGVKDETLVTTGIVAKYTIADEEITLVDASATSAKVVENKGDYLKLEGAANVYFGDVEVYDVTGEEPATADASAIAKDAEILYLMDKNDVVLVFIVK
jgi:hypothetical protein